MVRKRGKEVLYKKRKMEKEGRERDEQKEECLERRGWENREEGP